MKYLAIASLLALSACATKPVVVPDLPVIAQKTSVNIPPGLIADCDDLTQLDETKSYTQGDTADVVSVWSNEHGDCKRRFKKFVSLVAPVLNINEVPMPASSTAVN